ncbi:MAG: STAS domain-containing protein [Bacteroidia bacterium]|nr:STAS domain-containing protein [Bacteroidia bacterium]
MIFGYKSSKKEGMNVFLLQGELIDRNQADEMMKEVETAVTAGESSIILNLAELKYLNSSGLNILINILTKSRKAGGDVAICNINKKINELLVITKLNSVFNVCDSEEKAISTLKK